MENIIIIGGGPAGISQFFTLPVPAEIRWLSSMGPEVSKAEKIGKLLWRRYLVRTGAL